MIVSLTLSKALASAISLESGRRGQSPARYIEDRLADSFAIRPPAPSASHVKLIPEDTTDTHNDD